MSSVLHGVRVFIVAFGFVCATHLNAIEPEPGNDEQHRIDVSVPMAGTEGVLIPKADEVLGITVDLYNNPLEYANVERFDVQAKDIAPLLRYFENCVTDPMPNTGFLEIGSMKITEKSGNVITILWFWPLGKGPLYCAVKGVRLTKSRIHWQGTDDGLSVDVFVRGLLFDRSGKETRKATQ